MGSKEVLLTMGSELVELSDELFPEFGLDQIPPEAICEVSEKVKELTDYIADNWMPNDVVQPIMDSMASDIAGKFASPTGTASQVVLGDGSLGTMPSIPVASVFGRTGTISAANGDYNTSQVTEGSNLYFTDERAQDAVGTIMSGESGITVSYNDVAGTIVAAAPRTTSSETRTIQTSTGAVGWQISATKDSAVRYSVQIITTASIGGNQSGTVFLEICPTNSATAGDWVKVSEFTNGQALTLAITLQSVQTTSGQLCAEVPAGYYVKLRSVNNAGTPTFAYQSGQKTIYG